MAKDIEIIVSAKDAASEAFRKMGLEAEATSKKFKDMGSRLSGAGQAMTVGVTAPIVGVGAAALKMSVDFNTAMANIATLIPKSAGRVDELKKSIQELAVETGKSTDDLASGMYQVISAFGDSAESMNLLKVASTGAVAGLASTEETINMLSAVIKGYGLEMKDAAHVSDLAFMAAKIGQTTFGELASSMGAVVPMANALGVSQEELWGQMATLTGVTGNTSEVVTQLRATFQAVLKPTSDMAGAIRSLAGPLIEQGKLTGPLVDEFMDLTSSLEDVNINIAALEKAGETKGLGQLKTQAKELTKGITETAAGMGPLLVQAFGGVDNLIGKLADYSGGNTNILGKMFGSVEAINAVLAMGGAQADALKANTKAMFDVAGTTTTAFNEQANGINATGFSMGQFQQQMATVAQTLGDSLAPALKSAMDAAKPLIDGIASLARWFADLPAPAQSTILAITGLVAAIGPALMVAGSLASGFGAISAAIPIVTGVLPALGTALTVLTGPIGIVVAAVAGLTVAWTVWGDDIIKYFDEKIKPFFSNAWNGLKNTAVDAWNAILDFVKGFGLLGVFIDGLDITAPLSDNITKVGKSIGMSLRGAYNWAQGGINSISDFVGNMVDTVADKMKDLKDIGLTIGKTIWDNVKNAFSSAKDFILQIISNMIPDNTAGDLLRKGFDAIGLDLPNPTKKKMQLGGILEGYGGGDRIPALLEAGEAVIPKESVASHRGLIQSLIKGPRKYALGGVVALEDERDSAFADSFFDDGTFLQPVYPFQKPPAVERIEKPEWRAYLRYGKHKFGTDVLSLGLIPRTGMDEVLDLYKQLLPIKNLQATQIAERIKQKLSEYSPNDMLLGTLGNFAIPEEPISSRAGIGAAALSMAALWKTGFEIQPEDQIIPDDPNFTTFDFYGKPGARAAGYVPLFETYAVYPNENPPWEAVVHEQTHKYQNVIQDWADANGYPLTRYGKFNPLRNYEGYMNNPYEIEARKAAISGNAVRSMAEEIVSAGDKALLVKILNLVDPVLLNDWRKFYPELKLRNGGMLSGYGGGDRIPAVLEAGEAVIPKESVSKFPTLVRGLISGKTAGYADGGIIGAVSAIGGAIGSSFTSGTSDLGAALKNFGKGVLDVVNPINLLSDIVSRLTSSLGSMMAKAIEPLIPVIETLVVPISIVAEALGEALAPVLKALFPVFKLVGIVAAEFGKVLFNVGAVASDVVAGVTKFFGNLMSGLGSFLGTIEVFGKKPFAELANTLAQVGDRVAGFSEGATEFAGTLREGAGSLGEASTRLQGLTWDQAEAIAAANRETESFTETLRNVPSVFKATLVRGYAAQVPTTNATSRGLGGLVVNNTINIGNNASPEECRRAAEEGARQGTAKALMARYGVAGVGY